MSILPIVEKLHAKRYVRERWVEPVGTMDEPCDADDDGAQEILRNPDGPEAAEAISSLLKRVGELEGLAYHAEQAWTYIAQSTATEQQLASARFHINKMRDAFAALSLARGEKP